MAININREVEDAFYRYKMPKLAAKVEGKGNGIKTVIVNVSDIAKALNRKPIYVTKYFGCELGAQIHVDDKNERYIVNGAHDATKLQEILDGFIKKFVLCQECGNPETTMHVSKKSATVGTTCKACGGQGQLDVTHRLTQYIVKNPPDPEVVVIKTKTKKSRKNKNGTERNSDEDHDTSAIGDEGDHSPVNVADVDDNDWVEDTTEEAQMQRMNELSTMAKSLALSVDVEKSDSERADIFYKHLMKLEKSSSVLPNSREIKVEAERLNLGARTVLVVAEVLLRNPTTIVADIKKYTPVFILFTRVGENQKRSQQYLLGAMTKLIERSEEKLLLKACHILKEFYDDDIIEEDVILAWNEKGPSKKFVSKELSTKILNVCVPLIKWLKEADEEESDDSEENDYPDSQSIEEVPVAAKYRLPANAEVIDDCESEPDDIDIDAI